jgi:hypothetical protein
MNYQDVWDIANAIGYHRGRMRAVHNTRAIHADRLAFDAFLEKVPSPWVNTAIRAHDAGITEGDV